MTEPRPETASVSRERIAALDTLDPRRVTPGQVADLIADLRTEHDRAERLGEEVRVLDEQVVGMNEADIAHADLVADLRALCDDRGDFRLSEADAAELRALLDRHAPEKGCGHPDGWQYADGTCRCHDKRSTVIAPEEGS